MIRQYITEKEISRLCNDLRRTLRKYKHRDGMAGIHSPLEKWCSKLTGYYVKRQRFAETDEEFEKSMEQIFARTRRLVNKHPSTKRSK